jgi:proteasome lid subunit RPN8/RPN11
MHAEICGVLIGKEKDGTTYVNACIGGEKAAERGASVTFTQDTWEHIYEIKDKKFPDDAMVGWYHTHPGFGIFLSGYDLFIQKNFFSAPHQIAWVFDPQSGEEGCFGWKDQEIERLPETANRYDKRPTGEPPGNDLDSNAFPDPETDPEPEPEPEPELEPETETETEPESEPELEPKRKKPKTSPFLLICVTFLVFALGVEIGWLGSGFFGETDSSSGGSRNAGVISMPVKKDLAELQDKPEVVDDKLRIKIKIPNGVEWSHKSDKKTPQLTVKKSGNGVPELELLGTKLFQETIEGVPRGDLEGLQPDVKIIGKKIIGKKMGKEPIFVFEMPRVASTTNAKDNETSTLSKDDTAKPKEPLPNGEGEPALPKANGKEQELPQKLEQAEEHALKKLVEEIEKRKAGAGDQVKRINDLDLVLVLLKKRLTDGKKNDEKIRSDLNEHPELTKLFDDLTAKDLKSEGKEKEPDREKKKSSEKSPSTKKESQSIP